MIKKIFTVAILLFSALYGYGQVSWNVKAGMNVSKITNHGANDMKPGYQFGVGMDYFFTDHWGIQPSLMIISKGFKDKGDYYRHFGDPIEPYPSGWSFSETQDRIYIELPVMLAYRFNISNKIKLVLNGGGYISYGIGGKHKVTNIHEDGTEQKYSFNTFTPDFGPHGYEIERLDAGLGAGTAIEYKNRYIFSLFGAWGLNRVFYKSTNQTYGFNIGYKF